ncbi:methyltransferase domain-containing protein [Candidatus Gottesmanbacteria bacterium]|nr:methyltransferase domain-containing protein [Candidatus Gottesmanbacteria bacterium]
MPRSLGSLAMTPLMGILSYLIPQTILRTSSKYNRDIRINEERGKLKLLVNGSRQSGAYIERLWRRAFKAFAITHQNSVRSILVLGVAGGTVIQLLHRMYSDASITGVDIDEVMIHVGRTYFGLAAMNKLHLIRMDAKHYVRQAVAQKRRYDLVIVDLFFGRHIPAFIRSSRFLEQVKKLIQPDGRVIINYLREQEYKEQSDKLIALLQKMFVGVSDFGIFHNRFFSAN